MDASDSPYFRGRPHHGLTLGSFLRSLYYSKWLTTVQMRVTWVDSFSGYGTSTL